MKRIVGFLGSGMLLAGCGVRSQNESEVKSPTRDLLPTYRAGIIQTPNFPSSPLTVRAENVLASVNYLPTKDLTDACYARAHIIAAELAVAGIASQSLYPSSCKASNPLTYSGVTWRFHVVPVLSIGGRDLVIDVAMGRELQTKDMWLSQLGTSDFNAHYASSARYHHGSNALPLKTYNDDGDVTDCRLWSQFDPSPAAVSQMPKFHLTHLLTACSQLKYFARQENGTIKATDVVRGVKTLSDRLKANGLLLETGAEYNDCWGED